MSLGNKKTIKVVVIDDNFAIRSAVKQIVALINLTNKADLKIYSSASGVEGLGYVFVSRPNLIIVDTTLPKYSGLEILDFIASNQTIKALKIPVVILHEGNQKDFANMGKNFHIVSKKEKNFLEEIYKIAVNEIGYDQSDFLNSRINLKKIITELRIFTLVKFGDATVRWFNFGDRTFHKITNTKDRVVKAMLFVGWFLSQIWANFVFSIFYLFSKKVYDENLDQRKVDQSRLRVRYYPTLISVFLFLFLSIFQFLTFITGGIIIFSHIRLNGISALAEKESVDLNIHNADFDNTKLMINNNGLELIPFKSEVPVKTGDQPKTTEQPQQEAPVENTPKPEEPAPAPENQPEAPVETNPQPAEQQPVQEQPAQEAPPVNPVLGASTDAVMRYSTDNPVVTFAEKIEFTNITSILEDSSLNNEDNSIGNPINPADLKTRTIADNAITYQLSPNKADWYYFGGEQFWEKTDAGFQSSNTIQEVNQFLQLYTKQVSDNKLYVRVFFHSDGNTDIRLNNVTIKRSISVIADANEPEKQVIPETPETVISGQNQNLISYPLSYSQPGSHEVPNETGNRSPVVTSYPLSYPVKIPTSPIELPAPSVLNASFQGGDKIVSGRIDNIAISDDILKDFRVNVYYTDSRNIRKTSSDKDSLIGRSPVYKIKIGNATQYVFEVKAKSTKGGYVTSELEYIPSKQVSKLSKPVENSTFTVNETGDQADASAGDGSCDHDGITPGSQCTLRAAIQEANALAGSDNIYFNIPTSDSGYRDFDDPNTGSSGDGVGGDDYWTIRPATNLPAITETTIVDGSTQTSNQGDKNTSGPEIELNGTGVGASAIGITMSNLTAASTINSFVINNFGDAVNGGYGIKLDGTAFQLNGITVTNNYIGTDIKGTAAAPNDNGIYYLGTSNADNILLGTSTSDGNVISGNIERGVLLQCGSTGTANNVTIRGNKIGVDSTGNNILNNGDGTHYGIGIEEQDECNIQIGGTSSQRNYITSTQDGSIGIYLKYNAADAASNVQIYNNYFNAKANGQQIYNSLANDNLGIQVYGTTNISAPNPIKIGDVNKSNLILALTPIDFNGSARPIEVKYNTMSGYYGIFTSLDNSFNPIIENNVVAAKFSNDPYFGLTFDNQQTYADWGGGSYVGIFLRSGTAIIKGNYIEGYIYGIWYDAEGDADRPTGNDIVNQSIIGGQNSLSGSLCQGLEANCFKQNFNSDPNSAWASGSSTGLIIYDNAPANESTIYADNKFIGGNGKDLNGDNIGDNNIILFWSGTVELFSGTVRRTDLADGSLVVNMPANTYQTDFWSSGTLTNNATNCYNPGNCPASGSTSGINGKTEILDNNGAGSPANLGSAFSWTGFAEYRYDNSGKVSTKTWKFDDNHLASKQFTFDGNSTTDPVSPDRGEVWTEFPSATRDEATTSPGGFGRFQIMEAEVVDANPVWDGSKYVITVDSTTDEDNVSLAGYDDGDGAYSGGGYSGPDGLSNGKTSLREAITVANSFGQPVTIDFNIPKTDTGYRDFDDQNTPSSGDNANGDDYWTIRPGTPLPNIISTVHVDGSSQTTNQGNTNTSGPEIELNGVNDSTFSFRKGGLFFYLGSDGSSVNDMVINNYNLTAFTGGIYVFQVDGFTLTNSYLGTDIKGTSAAPNKNGIETEDSANINIGTSTANGNLLSGNSNFGIRGDCNNGVAQSITLRGNKIGTNVAGDAPLYNESDAIFSAAGACNWLIGGNSSQRNYITSKTNGIDILNIPNNGLFSMEVYNNYFNAKVNGDIIDASGTYFGIGITFQGGSYYGAQNTIRIGDVGKGNLFFSPYAMWIYPDREFSVAYNTIGSYNGIVHQAFDQPGNANTFEIKNNYISSYSSGDPYFNKSWDFRSGFGGYSPYEAIYLVGGKATVQGNNIRGYLWGVYMEPGHYNDRDNSNDIASVNTIGGQNSLSGSLCQGKEYNCFEKNQNVDSYAQNTMGAIVMYDNPAANEATLYSDNKFINGNGKDFDNDGKGDMNIGMFWSGLVELFSGTARRTDLADESLSIALPSGTYDSDYNSLGHLTNFAPNCFTGGACPASGGTNGINGKTEILGSNNFLPLLNNVYYWPFVQEYRYGNSSTKIATKTWKFEQNHLASKSFTFDGDSTTDPVSPDRAEVWSQYPSATRDVGTSAQGGFGIYQMMEAEYVDANPILTNGTYVITVDSLTDEDNVSLAGFDDGVGTYSGGGVNGPDGLSDGKTSLREALIAAKDFGQAVTIKFDSSITIYNPSSLTIPTSGATNRVTVDGTGTTFDGSNLPGGSSCFDIGTLNNITITNFTFSGCKASAVKVSGNNGITIRANKFSPTSAVKTPIDLVGGTEDSLNSTANDAGDTDSGPNELMNFPTITKVTYIGGGQYTVEGDIDHKSSEGPVTIEVCVLTAEFSNGHGGCTTSLGTTTASSPWSKTVTIPGDDGTQTHIFSALATNNVGSTSEFSSDFDTQGNSNYIIQDYPITLVSPIGNTTDTQPVFDWTASLDPDIVGYKVYLDGVLIATIPATQSFYQYSGTALAGTHTWNVVGIRDNDTQSGVSAVATFKVIPAKNLKLLYPINNISVDTLTPILKWSDENNSDVSYYEIYLDGKLFWKTIDNKMTYQITDAQKLKNGTKYKWQVKSFYKGLDANNNEVINELGESEVEHFTTQLVYAIVVHVDEDQDTTITWVIAGNQPPEGSSFEVIITDENGNQIISVGNIPADQNSYTLTGSQQDKLQPDHTYTVTVKLVDSDNNALSQGTTSFIHNQVIGANVGINISKSALTLASLIPLFGSILTALAATLLTFISLAPQLQAAGTRFLGLIFGLFAKKKRKYWGIIFDKNTNEPIPFALVRVVKGEALVTESISDFSGKYALLLNESGIYALSVIVSGYEEGHKIVSLSESNLEVLEDFALVKSGEKVGLIKQISYYSKKRVYSLTNKIILFLSFMGLLISIYATSVSPIAFNYFLLVLYTIMLIINLLIVLRVVLKGKGHIEDIENSKPIGGAVVRIFNEQRLLDIGITNTNGEIKFNLDAGVYGLLISKENFSFIQAKQAEDKEFYQKGLLSLLKLKIDKGGNFGGKYFLKKVEGATEAGSDNPFK